MANWKTQNLDGFGIAEKLGVLCERTESLINNQQEIKNSVEYLKVNGLPTCHVHTKRMETVERDIKEIKSRHASGNSDTLSYGKWKIGGQAVAFVGIIVAVGFVVVVVIKALK